MRLIVHVAKVFNVLQSAIIGVVMTLNLAHVSFAADWFLDSSAAGTSKGTSWENAWTNTSVVNWSVITEGDTLWVQSGYYNDLKIVEKSGIVVRIAPSAEAPAVFIGDSP